MIFQLGPKIQKSAPSMDREVLRRVEDSNLRIASWSTSVCRFHELMHVTPAAQAMKVRIYRMISGEGERELPNPGPPLWPRPYFALQRNHLQSKEPAASKTRGLRLGTEKKRKGMEKSRAGQSRAIASTEMLLPPAQRGLGLGARTARQRRGATAK